MKIDKNVIVTCLMVILLCTTFFFIGYGYAYKKSINYANEFLTETLSDKSVCLSVVNQNKEQMDEQINNFLMNITK